MNRYQHALLSTAIVLAAHLVCAGTTLAVLPATAPGTLDPGFGSAGKTTSAFANKYDYGRQLVIQPDGKYLLSGYGANTGFVVGFVGRYLRAGHLDPGF